MFIIHEEHSMRLNISDAISESSFLMAYITLQAILLDPKSLEFPQKNCQYQNLFPDVFQTFT